MVHAVQLCEINREELTGLNLIHVALKPFGGQAENVIRRAWVGLTKLRVRVLGKILHEALPRCFDVPEYSDDFEVTRRVVVVERDAGVGVTQMFNPRLVFEFEIPVDSRIESPAESVVSAKARTVGEQVGEPACPATRQSDYQEFIHNVQQTVEPRQLVELGQTTKAPTLGVAPGR